MEWAILGAGCLGVLLIVGLVLFAQGIVLDLYKLIAHVIPGAFGHVCSGAIKAVFGAGLFGKVAATVCFAAMTALFLAVVAKPYLLYYKASPLRLWELAVPTALASLWFWCRHYYHVLHQAEHWGYVKKQSAKCFLYFLCGALCSALVAAVSSRIAPVWPLWPPIMVGFAWKAALEWKRSMEVDSMKDDFKIDPASAKAAIVGHYEQERANRPAAARHR